MITAAAVFLLTYLVIGLQRLPRLHLGRPAGALLGATAMVLLGVLDFDTALAAIDLDTILFLLGMMVVVAYLELSGFFEMVERRVLALAGSARGLLALVTLSSGALAALFMNDTVCLMLTPVVLRAARRADLPPVPYLLALAMGANIGSTATIMGNPQNALIGIRSGIGLAPFAAALWPVAAAGLAVACLALAFIYRRGLPPGPLPASARIGPRADVQGWMLGCSLAAGTGMVAALAFGARPAAAAMTAAAVVVLAGATRPRRVLQMVDWPLLLFFGGLFVVMRGVAEAGLTGAPVAAAVSLTSDPAFALARLAGAATLLSQAVSNVPAVMLLMPALESLQADAARPLWLGLAAFATLAGNLTIIGSVANIIVFESARREGVEVGFGEYLRAGLPVTLLTLTLAWAWLALA